MKERPISFSAAMVRELLRDKTNTRRPVKCWEPAGKDEECFWKDGFPLVINGLKPLPQRYGEPGDRLWVKEGWRTGSKLDSYSPSIIGQRCFEAGYKQPGAPILYEADGQVRRWGDSDEQDFGPWGRARTNRFMPRWASRITLEITGVRVERVQEITEAGAKAEGAEAQPMCDVWLGDNSDPGYVTPCRHYLSYREGFKELWDSIYRKTFPWESNPWVWVVEFRRIQA